MYRVLGISHDADIEEIKDSYRRLVKQYHPDLNPEKRDDGEFERIVNAYETILRQKKQPLHFPVRDAVQNARQGGAGLKGKSIFALGELAVSGHLASIRIFATRSLGYSGKKSAYVFLRKALFDQDKQVVKAAVEAIGRLRIQQSSGELSSVYNREEWEIREKVLDAVSNMKDLQPFTQLIMIAMKSSNQKIRLKAVSLFSKIQKEK